MKLRNYQKPDPINEDLDIVPIPNSLDNSGIPVQSVGVPPTDYSKAEGIVEPTSFVVVFSNGEVREKNYFRWIEKNCDQLKLEFIPYPISPDDLLVEAIKKKGEYMLTTDDEHPDSYYAITDVDHFYNDILRSRVGYKNEGINLIISNPCFEVWLYYSRREDKFDGFVSPADPLKISQEVKRFVGKTIPGGVNPKRAVFDIKQNICNARANYAEDQNGIPSRFATNMYLLAEYMLPYIEPDILAWIEEEKRRAEARTA